MISTLCFIVVNVIITAILIESKKINIKFMLCLMFTFLGNLAAGMSINVILALINVAIGLKMVEE